MSSVNQPQTSERIVFYRIGRKEKFWTNLYCYIKRKNLQGKIGSWRHDNGNFRQPVFRNNFISLLPPFLMIRGTQRMALIFDLNKKAYKG
jgi:hypothetical protein